MRMRSKRSDSGKSFQVEVKTPPVTAGVMSPPSSDGPWQAPQRS